jgi:hypothetical protein
MKTTLPQLALAALIALSLFAGTMGTASAHDGQWDSRHHYYRDNYGYWNEHDRYTHYVFWHNHHGYWDNRGGTRVFINVD